MGVDLFPLRGKPNVASGADKQTAVQCLLHILDRPGHIGLVAVQHLRRFGKAAVLGYIIGYPVRIQITAE